MTTIKRTLVPYLLSIVLLIHPASPGKKKCGVKVVAIEHIQYKAVPVEVVEEKPKSKYSAIAAASNPVPSVKALDDPPYRVRQTTRTMDIATIFGEMLKDY